MEIVFKVLLLIPATVETILFLGLMNTIILPVMKSNNLGCRIVEKSVKNFMFLR